MRSLRLRRQHVLLTVAVELTHEIPYCPPNAMDVADPHAHFIYVWYRQYQLDTYETEWKSFKCCQTYVVQLEKSISQCCDTKCCHTNVAADPTIIECDEDVMLWGKMFDCNWVIIGLDLGVGDLFWKFIFSLNRAKKWFNSKFNSKQNPKYSFKKYSLHWVRDIQYNCLFKRLWGKSFKTKKKRPKNYSPRFGLDTQKIVGIIRNNCNGWGSWSFPRNR